jgi:hypothetical protein
MIWVLIGAVAFTTALVLIITVTYARRTNRKRHQGAPMRKLQSEFSWRASVQSAASGPAAPTPAAPSLKPRHTAPVLTDFEAGAALRDDLLGKTVLILELQKAGLDRASAERWADRCLSGHSGAVLSEAGLVADLEAAGLDRWFAEVVAKSYLSAQNLLLSAKMTHTSDLSSKISRSGGPSSSGASSSPVSWR